MGLVIHLFIYFFFACLMCSFFSHCLVYISELRNTYQSSQLPVTDDETTLHKFCVKLETVLRHEQKGRCLLVIFFYSKRQCGEGGCIFHYSAAV